MNDKNIDNTTEAVGWLERIMALTTKYSIWNWIEGFLVVFIAAVLVLFISHPREVVDYFTEMAADRHNELLQQRQENTTEVQSAIDRFLMKAGASRVVVCELHNGSNSISGIPFLKATATFEAIGDSIYPVASQYQNANLSLYPFANFLYTRGYWTGRTEDMQDIDKPLMYRMLSNSTTEFSACTIMGQTKVIGFIFVSFREGQKIELNPPELEREMRKLSVRLGVLLELRNK